MNTRTILIVDEEKINRTVLANILQADYSIILAANAQEAFRILKMNYKRISAIIIDLKMATMDGCEVVKNIHTNSDYANIPIIVSDKDSSEENEEKALSFGAHDFISRPYNAKIIQHRISNIIELTEAVKDVNLVVKDDLTPVNNKQYFLQKTRGVFTSNSEKEYDIVCLDVEQFKLVNDSYNVEVGDKILYKLGEILLKQLSNIPEAIVSRFTADNFFITIPHTQNFYDSFITEISRELHEYLPKIDVKLTLKICCGVYCVTDKTITIATMCDRAQLAAESIKGQYGKRVAFYEDEIRQQMHNSLAITSVMEYALKNDEFQVFYQPKYELASNCIAGAEALVRWVNSEMGVMYPASFIPLFERNGFITQLDMFVWETVCKDLREWMDMGKEPYSVSMNVSRIDIFELDIVNILIGLSEKYKINRKYLHLEITETAYTTDSAQFIKVVSQLREKGFPIEMDDFGSGYSSLNMLAEMPIDILKLDIGFIRNEYEKPYGKGILGFVITLAKWLNLAVVAEGVDNYEQIRVLTLMECNYVQGYHFSKPLEKAAFFELLSSGNVKEMYLTSSEFLVEKPDTVTIQRAKGTKIGTLLIVDDLELSRAIVSKAFQEEFDIVEAIDGLQAWNYIQENPRAISIILIDLLMPVMDGYQLIKNLRQNELTKNIPVVVTSQGNEFSEERALAMGANDFVPKPFNDIVLRHRVKNAFYYSQSERNKNETYINQAFVDAEIAMTKEPLTGLSTRKVLEAKIKDFFTVSSTKESVFIIIDLDNFKDINDIYGHIKGDETLKQVADILRNNFTNSDVVCRMGGDEFAIFIPYKVKKADLELKLEQLNKLLSFDVEQVALTCSIGVCVAPDFGTTYEKLYNNSDMALLASKRYGKNQYVIYAGQEILASKQFYRNVDWLLDEFSEAVIVFDKNSYELLYMNKSACAIVNKDKKDCIGKEYYQVIWNMSEPISDFNNIKFDKEDFLHTELILANQKYSLRTRRIDWGDSNACIQYITQVNE